MIACDIRTCLLFISVMMYSFFLTLSAKATIKTAQGIERVGADVDRSEWHYK